LKEAKPREARLGRSTLFSGRARKKRGVEGDFFLGEKEARVDRAI